MKSKLWHRTNMKQSTFQGFRNLFTKRSKEERIEDRKQLLSFKFMSELEKIMEAQEINKKTLAETLGTSASFITQLFRGQKVVNLKLLAQLEEAFDIDFVISTSSAMQLSKNLDFEKIKELREIAREFQKAAISTRTYSEYTAKPEELPQVAEAEVVYEKIPA